MKLGDLVKFRTIESFRSDIMLNYDFSDDEAFIKLNDNTICILVIEKWIHEEDVLPIDSCVCFVPSKNKNIILPKRQLEHV